MTMTPRAAVLLELQTDDDHVATLTRHVAALEASLKGDPDIDAGRDQLAAATKERRASEATVAAAELELSSLRERADAIQRRLYDGSVRVAADLITLQRELDGMRLRQTPLEDEVLAAMEHAESAAVEETALGDRLTTLEEARAAAAGSDTARLAELRQQLAAAEEERATVAAAVTPADLELYRRLAVHVQPAVVAVAGDACGGCRLPLAIHEARRVRANGELVQCSHCDRVLAP